MRRCALLAALATGLFAAGCGGTAGDLLALEVTGGAGNSHDRLRLTDDGRASCNGAPFTTAASRSIPAAPADW